jgi:hypothetical protein
LNVFGAKSKAVGAFLGAFMRNFCRVGRPTMRLCLRLNVRSIHGLGSDGYLRANALLFNGRRG